MRVQTDEEMILGSIRIDPQSSLDEMLDDGRAYLTIWAAENPGSPDREKFLVIHKSVIRSVSLETVRPTVTFGARE